MLDEATLGRVEAALERGDAHAAADVLMEDESWATFERLLAAAYGDVVDKAGRAAFAAIPTRRVRKDKDEDKKKTKRPPMFGEKPIAGPQFKTSNGVWVKQRSAALVRDITTTQRTVLREVILENFKAGKRPKFIVDDIRRVVGLLPRELLAVETRRQLHLDAGIGESSARDLADKYSDELLDLRADRIAITETVAAEAQGRREAWEFAQEEGIISPTTTRVWVASDDACSDCEAMDGEEADIDGTYEGGAEIPFHPWCLPGDALVSSIGGVSAISERRYEGDFIVLRTASNKQLACTVDHPVLTVRGFVAAKTIQLGDYVVASRGAEGLKAATDHYAQNIQTPIHQITESFRRSGGMRSVEMPTPAPQLDGVAINEQIDVVASHRLLMRDMYALLFKHCRKCQRVFVSVFNSLLANSVLAKSFEGEFFAPNSVVSRPGNSLEVLRRLSRIAGQVSLAKAAGRMPTSNKKPSRLRPADRKDFAQLVLSNSADVFLDKVVHVDFSSFSGHVFNIQTGSGAYLANGIFNHNCMCTEALNE